MLLGVRICNYDVFDDNKCGLVLEDFLGLNENIEITSKPLTNLTAFIGKNSTGKSSFIDALSFIKKSVTADVAVASTLNNRPGFSNLVIDRTKPSKFNMYLTNMRQFLYNHVVNAECIILNRADNVNKRYFEEKNDKIILMSRAENNKIIHFEGNKELVGTFCNVKVTKASVWHLVGEKI